MTWPRRRGPSPINQSTPRQAMTEVGWLSCPDPTPMLSQVRTQVSGRKLRLFACAGARVFARRMADPDRWEGWIRSAEREAEVEAPAPQGRIPLAASPSPLAALGLDDPFRAATQIAESVPRAVRRIERRDPRRAEQAQYEVQYTLAELVRDVFGNPFRPVAAEPAWLTSTVVGLAAGIYEERAFDRLPILADALMDAGCDHDRVLRHCRVEGVHARGCWLIDALLGKS